MKNKELRLEEEMRMKREIDAIWDNIFNQGYRKAIEDFECIIDDLLEDFDYGEIGERLKKIKQKLEDMKQ